MSKHESWRTRLYWETIGGTLIEEFVAVKRTPTQGRRLLDGLIIKDSPKKVLSVNYTDIMGKDVVILQTKKGRLGMNLLGQAFFSKFLIEMHQPNSIQSVAICGENDDILCNIANRMGIDVVVIPEEFNPNQK